MRCRQWGLPQPPIAAMTVNPDNPSPPAPRWQFSIRTLFLAMSGAAVAMMILVSAPNWIAVPLMICLAMAVPAALCVVMICGSSYQRTFCIGALFPTCTLLYVTGWLFGLSFIEPPSMSSLDDLADWLEFFDEIANRYRIYTATAWVLAILIGSMALGVRWYIEATAGEDKPGDNAGTPRPP